MRAALRILWVIIVIYIGGILTVRFTPNTEGDFTSIYYLSQIASLGLSLFTYTTIQFICDFYILLGYFTLAVILFMRRSDDWMAIFLSLMFITFGVRLTGIGGEIMSLKGYQYFFSPIMILGDLGIILFGWIYPDGHFQPRWLKYALPIVVINIFLLYWPGSPLYNLPTTYAIVNLLAWYALTVFALIYRNRQIANPVQRQQSRWVSFGMLGPLLWFVLFNVLAQFIPALQDHSTTTYVFFQIVARVFSVVLFLIFPAFVTLAIARYKLFDLDFLINRTLVYGALTAVLASVFGLILVIANAIFSLILHGQQITLGLALSALAAGALFQPTRKALQRFVDRTFYNINIDYLKTPVKKQAPRQPHDLHDTRTLAPMLFSSYKSLELIGKGGMAEVYRAEHPTQNRTVAIKVLLSTLAEDEQFRKRFMREAQTLSGLEHPNIVRLHDFGEENGLYYIIMEYLNGINLSTHLKQNGHMPLNAALPMLHDIAQALDYAHAAGLVHRDIKPSNVMLDTQAAATRAVLTDFGIAKLSGAHTNITASAVLGTFDYIAPEQIQGSTKIDGRADLYALGVMTYQLLTGSLPYKRPGSGALLMAHMTAPVPDARESRPSLPRHVALAIQRAMAKKPADRYPTAAEFVLALN